MTIYRFAQRKIVDVEDGYGMRLIEQGEAIYIPPQEIFTAPQSKAAESPKDVPPTKKPKAKRGVKAYEPKDKD